MRVVLQEKRRGKHTCVTGTVWAAGLKETVVFAENRRGRACRWHSVSSGERPKVVTSLDEFQNRRVLNRSVRDTSRFYKRGDDKQRHTRAQTKLIDLGRGHAVAEAAEVILAWIMH